MVVVEGEENSVDCPSVAIRRRRMIRARILSERRMITNDSPFERIFIDREQLTLLVSFCTSRMKSSEGQRCLVRSPIVFFLLFGEKLKIFNRSFISSAVLRRVDVTIALGEKTERENIMMDHQWRADRTSAGQNKVSRRFQTFVF